MRIATVTAENYSNITDQIDFFSLRTFLDYDILIWEPNFMMNKYKYTLTGGEYRIHDKTLYEITNHIRIRNEELINILDFGKTVLIYLPFPEVIYNLDKNYYDYPFIQFEILKNIKTSKIIGKQTNCRAEEPFISFWEKTRDCFEYKAKLDQPFGRPLFFIKGTQMSVGSYARVKNGHVIFIPSFVPRQEHLDSDKSTFINAAVTLVEDLNFPEGSKSFQLPSWSKSYILPSEHEQKAHLQKLEEELDVLLQKIDQQKNLIEQIEKYKILFVGSGKLLELQVKKVFEALGFISNDVLPNRDDLILKHGDRIAVVEIKSIARKSAAEKHAAQLEKWASEYLTTHEVRPKGILIANAYSEIPLEDRNEAPFPDQMLHYSKGRDHCLMTSLQLLCLYLDCRDNEEKRNKMIDLIFNTNGVFSAYQDWASFIEKGEDTDLHT